ncbi:hypothetical protein LLE49_06585 [Alicyclobacillus tolerans]|uniref:hypothetical protein n=1 Tax=Alicyclobacillus tolerans TaxID=90970 RepID=UPI001F3CA2C6|nr:hypothetical protein [Alicyclobacillus tolerans]MCF8564411.1 hypothetical protein [Alicyclobacillus tolerans]
MWKIRGFFAFWDCKGRQQAQGYANVPYFGVFLGGPDFGPDGEPHFSMLARWAENLYIVWERT